MVRPKQHGDLGSRKPERHRFVSSDSMACHISVLRMQLKGKPDADVTAEKTARNSRLKSSGFLLLFSGLFLGVGALALAISSVALLKKLG